MTPIDLLSAPLYVGYARPRRKSSFNRPGVDMTYSYDRRKAAQYTFNVGDRVKVKVPVGGFRRGEVVRVMGRFSDLGGEKYVVRSSSGEQSQLSVDQLVL